MKVFNPTYFQDFQTSITSHNIKSGEIIIEIYYHNSKRYNTETIIQHFFFNTNIQTENSNYKIIKLKRSDAIDSIKYGLNTKANYTQIDKEFIESERIRYTNGFIKFFNNPDFYTVNTRIYQIDLDLDDFWEVGGSILIDDDKVGVFWINDLYDKFN